MVGHGQGPLAVTTIHRQPAFLRLPRPFSQLELSAGPLSEGGPLRCLRLALTPRPSHDAHPHPFLTLPAVSHPPLRRRDGRPPSRCSPPCTPYPPADSQPASRDRLRRTAAASQRCDRSELNQAIGECDLLPLERRESPDTPGQLRTHHLDPTTTTSSRIAPVEYRGRSLSPSLVLRFPGTNLNPELRRLKGQRMRIRAPWLD